MPLALGLAAVCAAAAGDAATPAGEAPPAPPRDQQSITAGLYLRRGLDYLSRPRPEDQIEAERLLQKALRLDRGLAAAHAGLARIAVYFFNLGLDESPERLGVALEQGRRAVEIAPEDAGARAANATALAAADRLTPALEEARRSVAIDPLLPEGHSVLCAILRLRKDLDGALAACRQAGALTPGDPRVLTGLGDVLREQDKYGEALEIYGQAIELDYQAIAPHLGAAATLARAGNAPVARRAYNRLLGGWDYAQDRIRLAAAAYLASNREFEAALDMYERVEIPGNSALPALLALYGKGYCLLQLGRPAEAEYFLSRLIERVPRDYDGPARGREFLFRSYEELAGYFEGRGRSNKVESLLQSACGRPLAPTRLARHLAGLLQLQNRDEAAGKILEQALTNADPLEDPLELGESAILLARLRSGGGRRPLPETSPALTALGLAGKRIEPSFLGAAHYRLARAYALAGRSEAALVSLGRARDCGYLPLDQMAEEPDFQALRREPGFESLLRP